MNRKFIIILSLFIWPVFAPAHNFIFDNVTTKDGLSSRDVRCIVQDCYGMIWIGTDEGLNRYDGSNFTVYKHEANSIGLHSSWINCLYAGSDDLIWIGTEQGLTVFNPHSGELYPCEPECDNRRLLSTQRIKSIYEGNDSVMWIGTYTGLIKYNKIHNSLEFFNIAHGKKDLRAREVTNIIQDCRGALWLGTFDGLYKFDPSDNTAIWFKGVHNATSNVNNYIEKIYYRKNDDVLYVGSSCGFTLLDLDGNIVRSYNTSNSGICGDDVCEIIDYDGKTMILGTSQGMSIYDTKTEGFTSVMPSEENTSILDNYVRVIYEDKGGIIWIGTSLGLSKLDRNHKPMTVYPINYAGERARVKDISAMPDNTMWLATNNGILVCDNSFDIIRHYGKSNGLKHDIINRIFVDSHNTIWVGTNDGLQYFDGKADRFIEIKNSQFKYIYDIKETPDGEIIANIIDGLAIITPLRDSKGTIIGSDYSSCDFSGILSQSNSSIPYFDIDSQGVIWTGTISDGIIEYKDKNNYKIIGEKDGLISNRIYSIFIDSNDVVWIGTDCGLSSVSPDGKIRNYSDHNLKASVRIITDDAHKRLWLAYASKVIMCDLVRKEQITTDLRSQLGIKEIIHNAVTVKGENIYMSGDGFVICFNPDLIHVNEYVPDPVISSFEIMDGYSSSQEIYAISRNKITLKHFQNNFCIRFAIPNYAYPAANKYEYRLDGFDDIWHTTSGKDNYARYSNLKPGTYRFDVRGYNADGVQNNSIKSLSIIIRAPWWASKAAVLTYIIAGILIIWIFLRMASSKIKTDRRLEREQDERKKAEELNELKTEFFTNISHEFKTPLSLIVAPTEALINETTDEKAIQQLNIIRQNSERLKNLINRIMDLQKIESGTVSLNLVSGNIVSYIHSLTNNFKSAADNRHITLGFESDCDNILMNFDDKKIEKVIFNLLSNSYKYTKDFGTIVVKVTKVPEDSNYISVTVSDNGCGITEKDLPHIFERFYQGHTETVVNESLKGSGIGLRIVKEYVELHGGEVSVKSESGKGTSVQFSLSTQLGENEIIGNIQEGLIKTDEIQSNKKKAVIIEDDHDMLSFLKLSLEPFYNVFTAVDGKSGHKLIMDIFPDIIISDLMMKGMDGFNVCKLVRKDPLTSHIPFIILTASTEDSVQRQSYEAGVDVFLVKPFSIKTLTTRIETILKSRQDLQDKYRKQFIGMPSEIVMESFDDKLLHDLVEIVEKNMSDPDFGVQQLIEQSKFPYQQIYRKVKTITGESINEFIRNIRLKRAAMYLVKSDLRVSEIMYNVGFNSHSYSTKCFKKYFGCSPTDFVGVNGTDCKKNENQNT